MYDFKIGDKVHIIIATKEQIKDAKSLDTSLKLSHQEGIITELINSGINYAVVDVNAPFGRWGIPLSCLFPMNNNENLPSFEDIFD